MRLPAVVLGLVLVGACASSSSTNSGASSNSLSGTAVLTFSTPFVGSATTSGTCPVCGGLPGGGGSSPSGPASYEGVVVVMSDDPNIQASCGSDAGSGYAFDLDRYHYLTIQVVSTDTIAPGSYSIHSALSQADGGMSYAYVEESRPLLPDASSGVGFVEDDNGSGTVNLTGLGSVVKGSFTATGLEQFGGGPADGDLSGTFAAPSCPFLVETAFESPCGACPG